MKNIAQIQELKAELQKVKDTECDLRCENQQLEINLQHHVSETDSLMKKIEQKETEYEELLLKLENGKKEVITFKLYFLINFLFLNYSLIVIISKLDGYLFFKGSELINVENL